MMSVTQIPGERADGGAEQEAGAASPALGGATMGGAQKYGSTSASGLRAVGERARVGSGEHEQRRWAAKAAVDGVSSDADESEHDVIRDDRHADGGATARLESAYAA